MSNPDQQAKETKRIAVQILAGLLSNPHIYASMSDEGAAAPQVQELVGIAVEMAEQLIAKVDARHKTE